MATQIVQLFPLISAFYVFSLYKKLCFQGGVQGKKTELQGGGPEGGGPDLVAHTREVGQGRGHRGGVKEVVLKGRLQVLRVEEPAGNLDLLSALGREVVQALGVVEAEHHDVKVGKAKEEVSKGGLVDKIGRAAARVEHPELWGPLNEVVEGGVGQLPAPGDGQVLKEGKEPSANVLEGGVRETPALTEGEGLELAAVTSEGGDVGVGDLGAVKDQVGERRGTEGQGLYRGGVDEETVTEGEEAELVHGLVHNIEDEGVWEEEVVLGGAPLDVGLGVSLVVHLEVLQPREEGHQIHVGKEALKHGVVENREPQRAEIWAGGEEGHEDLARGGLGGEAEAQRAEGGERWSPSVGWLFRLVEGSSLFKHGLKEVIMGEGLIEVKGGEVWLSEEEEDPEGLRLCPLVSPELVHPIKHLLQHTPGKPPQTLEGESVVMNTLRHLFSAEPFQLADGHVVWDGGPSYRWR